MVINGTSVEVGARRDVWGCCGCGLLVGLLRCVADFLVCFVLLCLRFWVC